MMHAAALSNALPGPLPWVLASSSPSRTRLMQLLGYPFVCRSPDIDETPLPHESAETLVGRLAHQKAQAVAGQTTWPAQTLIIAADTVAAFETNILGKPGDHATAVSMLQAMSGKTVCFYTGLCVHTVQGTTAVTVDCHTVAFRHLSDTVIRNYLAHEAPYGLSAGFKSEGMGAVLIHTQNGPDPHAIQGLPILRLSGLLSERGWPIPGCPTVLARLSPIGRDKGCSETGNNS